jgi:ParB family chromosome partitioning protein
MATNKRQALGRGLNALLNGGTEDVLELPKVKTTTSGNNGSVAMVAIKHIEANPFQPRNEFEQEALQELAESIKTFGIIQPVTLRKMSENKYQLISGERRFRASQMAGLVEIPAYIRTADDQSMLEMALVENIQREDLNAIDVALSYQRLIDECSLTQEKLGERIAKNRSTVTNYLRLLKLPTEVQVAIKKGKITMGHARAIINAGTEEQQLEILTQILNEDLSVRQVEEIAKTMSGKRTKTADNYTKDTESAVSSAGADWNEKYTVHSQKLTEILKKKVSIQSGKNGSGKILIDFSNEKELEKIIECFEK